MPAESGWISAPTLASSPGGSSMKQTEAAKTSNSASARGLRFQTQNTARPLARMKLTTKLSRPKRENIPDTRPAKA